MSSLSEDCITNIACGMTHAACCSDEGKMFTWGMGNCYQLGHEDKSDHYKPKQIASLNGIVQVSCSRGEKYAHSGCVDRDGKVWTWGSNYKGKLGHDEAWSHAEPENYPKPA